MKRDEILDDEIICVLREADKPLSLQQINAQFVNFEIYADPVPLTTLRSHMGYLETEGIVFRKASHERRNPFVFGLTGEGKKVGETS